jgi:hypothetical protein
MIAVITTLAYRMLLSHQQPTNSPNPPREFINQLSRVTTQKAYLAYWNRL